MRTRPTMFIGSSTEGLAIVRELERQLTRTVDVTPWLDVVSPSHQVMTELQSKIGKFDFAVMVATPDITLVSRSGKRSHSAKANVFLEFGLAAAHLGNHRVYVVHPDRPKQEFPSDFAGFQFLHYSTRRPLASALSDVVAKIRGEVKRHRLRINDTLIADARVIRNPKENYDAAIKLLKRGFREHLIILEVSDSGNDPIYENVWADLVGKVRPGRAPQVYRMFDEGVSRRASTKELKSWAKLETPGNAGWFHSRVVRWPVDILVLATPGHKPIEALVGMSSALDDRWMAVETTNPEWVDLLREYAWQAANNDGPRVRVQDLISNGNGARS